MELDTLKKLIAKIDATRKEHVYRVENAKIAARLAREALKDYKAAEKTYHEAVVKQ